MIKCATIKSDLTDTRNQIKYDYIDEVEEPIPASNDNHAPSRVACHTKPKAIEVQDVELQFPKATKKIS